MNRRRNQSVVIALAALLSREAQARAVAVPVLDLAAVQDQLRHLETAPRRYEGPPLTLKAALDEALAVNPELVALRKQVEAMRFRPAQERFLAPPMVEAQVWQWPLNTLNPLNTNMYIFMVTQELPGRGKRTLRAAVAEKDVTLAETDVAVRARQIVDGVKMAYADLFVSRIAVDIHLASVDLLRQLADISQIKYTTGRISQQDVLKSVVEISRLHDDLIKFEQQADLARARLNVLLDRAPDAPIGPLVDPYERVLVTGCRRPTASCAGTATGAADRACADREGPGGTRRRAARLQARLLSHGRVHAAAQSNRRLDGKGGYHVAPSTVVARVALTPESPKRRRLSRRRRRGSARWKMPCVWQFRMPTCT